MTKNLFDGIPSSLDDELSTTLASSKNVTVERIVSRGHTSPAFGWHDQPRHEWVVVLQGQGVLSFEDGNKIALGPGDHLTIPARRRHRVLWTDPNEATVWLAVHYD